MPTLSVVIPTRDRPGRLGRCLAALGRQTLAREDFEVVVVDDASSAAVRPVAQQHGAGLAVSVVRLEHARGPAGARNAGWRAARGEAVLFLDDDVEPASDLLATAAGALAAAGTSVSGVEGQVVPEDAVAADNPFAHTLTTGGGGHTCNIAYWRSALEAVGGFDEGFPGPVGEDYDLAYRMRARVGPIAFEPGMRALHAVHGVRTMRAGWRQRRGARPSLVRLFVKHPDQFQPRFVPSRWRGVAGRWLAGPTTAALAGYFLLQNLVAAWAWRGLLPRRPLLFLSWLFYLAVDGARICLDLPRLARTRRAVAAEVAAPRAAAA